MTDGNNILDGLFPAVSPQYSVTIRDVLLAFHRAKGNNHFALQIPRLEVQAGSIRCVYGTNGCGKTTFLRTVADVIQPQEGSVMWSPDSTPRLGADLVLVTQAGPMPHWTVRENITAPMHNQGLSSSAVQNRAAALIDLLGLQGLDNRYAHQLSAGQQQRTVLARALSVTPKVLLLDEIMSGQSEYWAARIGEMLRHYASRGGTLVIVSHDPEWVMTYGDTVCHIISDHTDAVSTTRFYVGYDGPANQWHVYRETRYGKQNGQGSGN